LALAAKALFTFNMLPFDTITIFNEISGTVQHTLVSGNDPKTIIAVSMQQSKDLSDTILLCGNDILAKNYAKDLPQNIVNYPCSDDIIISKTGNDLASVIISYVPYSTSDLATSTQYGYNPTANIASSSDIQVYGSISAGEIMVSLFLFLLLWVKLVEVLAKGLDKLKTKKTFISYQNGDVEVRDDY